MGLLSNLMGQKLIGTIKINFYSENEAFVEYETEVSDQEQKEIDLIQLFALYYSKMLYNLNRSESADELIVCVQKAIENVISKKEIIRANILTSEQKLVEQKIDNITKKYSGELYEKSNQTKIIQVHLELVGENYYIPISTIMFLQYLVNNISENSLMFLSLIARGMNKYYNEIGDYSDMTSIMQAPSYGFNIATQMLSGDK